MNLIFHITQKQQWQAAQQSGTYRCESLVTEGFIHCSTAYQVIAVANHFFKNQNGLVLLGIEPDRLQAELRYEEVAGSNQRFPHLYGALNLDAVTQVIDFEPDADGLFALPQPLQR
ncbi:MAG: DUF952 domain-containing protein [Elainellaceae cyanobacterium]